MEGAFQAGGFQAGSNRSLHRIGMGDEEDTWTARLAPSSHWSPLVGCVWGTSSWGVENKQLGGWDLIPLAHTPLPSSGFPFSDSHLQLIALIVHRNIQWD